MKRVLLDTNAYSKLMSGDTEVLDALGAADRALMSVVVLGELFAGFRGGTRYSENVERLREFLDEPAVHVAEATEETAEVFGEIQHSLRTAGTPVPLNDIWIAAHCFEHGATLITFDTHFAVVPGLRLWASSKQT